MIARTRWLASALLAAATVWWLSGCSKTDTGAGTKANKSTAADRAKEGEHKEAGHKEGGHKEGDHKDHKEGGHDEKPLTEKDVKLPDSFKAGVARLEELHKTIGQHIEHGELAKVPHPAAEEMALVARKMKELAQKDVPEDKQTEAGRLCNEVAGYYKAIDEAADAGKKAETEAIHKQMGSAIEKLKALAK